MKSQPETHLRVQSIQIRYELFDSTWFPNSFLNSILKDRGTYMVDVDMVEGAWADPKGDRGS